MLMSYGLIILLTSAINCKDFRFQEERKLNEIFCSSPLTSCKCNMTIFENNKAVFIFSCSHDELQPETEFKISFKNVFYIQIVCISVSSFKKIPNFTNFIRVDVLGIRNCEIPRNETLYELTSKISKNLQFLRIYFKHEERQSSFNKNLFQGFSNLKNLQISTIDSLESDIFEHLVNLNMLTLFYVPTPEGILDTMNKLEILFITTSTLILTAEVFKNQKNLTQLRLGCTADSFLDPLTFTNLPNLEILTIEGNCLISWSKNMFRTNHKLKLFALGGNKILISQNLLVPANLIKGYFIDCNIQKLSEDLFQNSTNIQELHLSYNQLISLPKDIFVNQKMLRDLDLSRNQIMDLSDGLFDTTLNMEKLNLSRNNLTGISRLIFAKLKFLGKLTLSYNQLTTIDDSFRNLVRLNILDVQNNQLSNTERLFENTIFLKQLYLNNNNINNFSIANNVKFHQLQLINLSQNNLQTFYNGRWMNVDPSLKIDLSYNNISRFKIKDFLRNVIDNRFYLLLVINNNPIVCDCNALELVQIGKREIKPENIYKHFDLNVNELTCQKPIHLYNRSIISLSTSELICNIEKDCPDGCQCQQRPVDNTLIFECSVLQEFPTLSTYANLNLTSIELTYCLTNNNDSHQIMLNNIPDDLTQIDLRNNSLQTLDNNIIDKFKSIDKLFLSGNSWICNCDNAEIVSFYNLFRSQIIDADDMMCADGQHFNSVVAKDLCAKQQKIDLFVVLLLGTSLLLLCSTIYLIYRKEIKMWLYVHNCCLWWVSEEEVDKDKNYDAFFIFSHLDNNFVTDLIMNLESPPKSYKCCVHHRDWPAGGMIITSVLKSIRKSRRIIVVLSPSFLESNWATWEFRVSLYHAFKEKRSRVIVIIYGDPSIIDDLDDDLKTYVKFNTYLNSEDQWFDEKLLYAMPHKAIEQNDDVVNWSDSD